MQFKLQHADSQTDDPHDVIAAQLRDLAPRLTPNQSEAHAPPTAVTESASEPSAIDTPLNDNIGDIRDPASRTGFGRSMRRLALIACTGCVMAAVWYSYGDAAKQRISDLVPQLLVSTPAPAQVTKSAQQQDAASPIPESQQAAAPVSAPETVATPPAAPAESATPPSTQTAEASPAQVELSLELAKSVETMAREIASLKETVEQLQAGQRQLSRDLAKATEQTTQRKPVAQAAKPAPAPRRPPSPAAVSRTYAPSASHSYSPSPAYPQTAAQREAYIPPPAPAPVQQLPPPPGDTSVPRPPMPLR